MSKKTQTYYVGIDKMRPIFALIPSMTCDELASLIEEIRCVHDNLIAWDVDTKRLVSVKSICVNGNGIQLNLEKHNE